MNKEQLQMVQRTFGAFGWPENKGAVPAIEIDGDYISIANGFLTICETNVEQPSIRGKQQVPGFMLERVAYRTGTNGEPDDVDTQEIATDRYLPNIVIKAIALYAEHQAKGIMDDMATEAMVKEWDEWHEELL